MVLLSVAACSGSQSDAEPAAPAELLTCEHDFERILAALRSGLPTYGYNPAIDLNDLLLRSDLVLTGTVHTIQREEIGSFRDLGPSTWTVLSSSNARVLSSKLERDYPVPTSVRTTSFWAARDEPDPLARPISVENLKFVAFLHAGIDQPADWTTDVQCLHVFCVGSIAPPAAVVIDLPMSAAQLGPRQLIASISNRALTGDG
jgi:hypothetical protein